MTHFMFFIAIFEEQAPVIEGLRLRVEAGSEDVVSLIFLAKIPYTNGLTKVS